MPDQLLTAFIIDDEFRSREVIILMLKKTFPYINIVGQAANVHDAFEGIYQTKPQLVFLDVQLQNETGFDLLDKLPEIKFEIVFTTAHSEHAVKAFRYSALDYLIKPIDANELKAAVEKAIHRISSAQFSVNEQVKMLHYHLNDEKKFPDKIAIPTPEGLVFISVKEIIYCRGLGNYTEFMLVDEQKLISSHTLKNYEEILDSGFFFRAHKSYLINLGYIKKYIRGEGGTVVMSNGHEVEIARRNKTAFLNFFKG